MPATKTKLVRIVPTGVPNIYAATEIDPNLGIWPGPGPLPPLEVWPKPPEGEAPLPEHPIALPDDPWWSDLHPEHPIVLPPDGEVPPDPPPGTGSLNCRWGYQEEGGWKLFCVYDPQGGGKPRPPRRR